MINSAELFWISKQYFQNASSCLYKILHCTKCHQLIKEEPVTGATKTTERDLDEAADKARQKKFEIGQAENKYKIPKSTINYNAIHIKTCMNRNM